jgi:hypothetical protein
MLLGMPAGYTLTANVGGRDASYRVGPFSYHWKLMALQK